MARVKPTQLHTFISQPLYTESAKYIIGDSLKQQIIRNNALIKIIIKLNFPELEELPAYMRLSMLHPGVVMWKNNLGSLFSYARACVEEFEMQNDYGVRVMQRPYSGRPKCIHHFFSLYDEWILEKRITQEDPWWLGYQEFHARCHAIPTAPMPCPPMNRPMSRPNCSRATGPPGCAGTAWPGCADRRLRRAPPR